MWHTSRHFQHPVHPQHHVTPYPTKGTNDMPNVPVPVWIAAAIILGLIAIAFYGYTAGLWETAP